MCGCSWLDDAYVVAANGPALAPFPAVFAPEAALQVVASAG